jgi:putative ABC transport system substrate-binding protein
MPLTARGQQGNRVPRVGVLMSLPEADPQTKPRVEAFRQGLREVGLQDGLNVHIEYRWGAENLDQAIQHAKALIDLNPDVILGVANPSVTALARQTRTIPIIFVLLADPVVQGFVTQLARPERNITGFASFDPSLGSKWLELLKEIAPQVSTIAVLFNPDTVAYAPFVRSIEAAAPSFVVEPIITPVRGRDEIEQAIKSAARQPNGGLVLLPDTHLAVHRRLLIDLAAKYALPSVCGLPYYARDGGLVSYGPDLVEQFRRAPTYIDRILKGSKPSELPVQQPTTFDLIINLKTAKALGLEVPVRLQQLANELIE